MTDNRHRFVPLLLAAVATAGCAESYVRSADRQVEGLISRVEEATLDYQPQVVAERAADEIPKRPAYEKIPQTRLPKEDVRALVPETITLPYSPLGPEPLSADADARAMAQAESIFLQLDLAQQLALGDLELGPPPPGGDDVVRLGIFEAIRFGVENSREYRSRMEDLYLTALSVTLERHLFRPTPFAGGSYTYNQAGADQDFETALVATAEAGVAQQLPYGGEIVASALVNIVDALEGNIQDAEDAQLALRASIPLLRGAGLINLEPLIQTERDLVYATRAFEDYRRGFAVETAEQYFRLLTAQQQVRNRYLRYLSSLQLVARTEALFGAGNVDALEVQRAQQQALEAEDDLNEAQADYQTDLDDFKLFLGMDVDRELEIVPVRLVVEAPDLDSNHLIETALSLRLDLQTERDEIEDARRSVANAKNGLLPDLELEAEGRIGNDEDGFDRLDDDTAEFTAGLRLELPLDRLAERNILRARLIELARSGRDVRELEDRIKAQVRRGIREIRSAQSSLRIQEEGIEIARTRLDFANESLLLGLTDNSRNVVEAQDALLRAQDRFDEAQADLQIAILQFLRDTGTLRVDPDAGSLGRSMRRRAVVPPQEADLTVPPALPDVEAGELGELGPNPAGSPPAAR